MGNQVVFSVIISLRVLEPTIYIDLRRLPNRSNKKPKTQHGKAPHTPTNTGSHKNITKFDSHHNSQQVLKHLTPPKPSFIGVKSRIVDDKPRLNPRRRIKPTFTPIKEKSSILSTRARAPMVTEAAAANIQSFVILKKPPHLSSEKTALSSPDHKVTQ